MRGIQVVIRFILDQIDHFDKWRDICPCEALYPQQTCLIV